MDTNNKNKNASHLTHKMKNEHGDLAEANKRANEQRILLIVTEELGKLANAKQGVINAKDKRIDAQKTIIQNMEKEKQAMEEEQQERDKEIQIMERLKELGYQLRNMQQLPNDSDTIDIEPEDEKD